MYSHFERNYIKWNNFSAIEPGGTWTLGKKSSLEFVVNTVPPNVQLIFDVTSYGRQKINVSINGNKVFSDIINGRSKILIESNALKNGINKVEFFHPDARKPGIHDNRVLAFMHHNLEVRTLDFLVPENSLSKAHYGKILVSSQNGNALSFLYDGWSHPEHWGTWSNADKAQLVFYLGDTLPSHIEMDLNALLAGEHKQQRMRPMLNGVALQEIILRSNQELISLDISKAVKQGKNHLVIELPDVISPKKLGINSDARMLAIGLKSLCFVKQVQ